MQTVIQPGTRDGGRGKSQLVEGVEVVEGVEGLEATLVNPELSTLSKPLRLSNPSKPSKLSKP
jgi:hypothetical protein